MVAVVLLLAACTERKQADIYIWDGTAEVTFYVSVSDSGTRAALPRATITLMRDSQVARAIDGQPFADSAAVVTDAAGDGALKARFPAAGSAGGIR